MSGPSLSHMGHWPPSVGTYLPGLAILCLCPSSPLFPFAFFLPPYSSLCLPFPPARPTKSLVVPLLYGGSFPSSSPFHFPLHNTLLPSSPKGISEYNFSLCCSLHLESEISSFDKLLSRAASSSASRPSIHLTAQPEHLSGHPPWKLCNAS